MGSGAYETIDRSENRALQWDGERLAVVERSTQYPMHISSVSIDNLFGDTKHLFGM